MTRSILLTGGAGFIGSHTYVALVEAGYRVVILDDFSNSSPVVLERLRQITGEKDICLYRGSVLDRSLLNQILAEQDISAVVHFAAKKAVSESVAEPLSYFNTNLVGLVTLLQSMKAAGVLTLVFSSSATVYGSPSPQEVPLTEESPRSFLNPYGFTKLSGEHILEQAAEADPWVFGVLRYFNPVGAHPSGLIGEDPKDVPNNLVPYIAKVAKGELPYLQVFGDDYPTRDGTGERDYVHVMDLARGHMLSLDKLLESGESHLVNLGTGRASSVLRVLDVYSQVVGRDLPYRIMPRRAGDVPIYQADVTRAAEVLGFKAQYDLLQMCQSSWHWIQTNDKQLR